MADDTDGQLQRAPFRIAFRHEGNAVTAYLAHQGTMKDAIALGAMNVRMFEGNTELWERWKTLIEDGIKEITKQTTGVEIPKFTEEPAPEHEKAGRA